MAVLTRPINALVTPASLVNFAFLQQQLCRLGEEEARPCLLHPQVTWSI
jgi:hypothetical protein